MNRRLLSLALVMVILCALLIALGIRQENKAGGSKETGGDQVKQEQQESTEHSDPITATLAVCGDVMSHSPRPMTPMTLPPIPTAT